MSRGRRKVAAIVATVVVVVASAAALSVAARSGGARAPGPSPAPPSAGAQAHGATVPRAVLVPPAPPPTIYAGPEGRELLGPTWSYRADPHDAGLAAGWRHGRFAARRISVPHSPNAHPTTGPAGFRNFQGAVGWYRKGFRVARTGRYAIRFESVHHRATVWVDGRRVGRHVGAYRPWEVRPVLRAGHRHRVVVRADWRFPLEQKRTAWHRGWFNYGGLHREVSVRRLGRSELEAPNLQTRLSPHGSALVSLAVRVHNRDRDRTMAVEGTLRDPEGHEVRFGFPPRQVPSGARETFRSRVEVPNPALWSTGDPKLYELRLAVAGEAAFRARVGLRELRWTDGRAYLNGRPLFLRGASIHEDVRGHGDALTAQDQKRLVGRLASVGANATRAQHPLHPALMERLDAAGILVWQQIGPWDSPGQWMSRTAALRRLGVGRVRESLEQLQLHPSVFAWNLGNEVAATAIPDRCST
jgi:beta-galactosidase/beta-glucuronidase